MEFLFALVLGLASLVIGGFLCALVLLTNALRQLIDAARRYLER